MQAVVRPRFQALACHIQILRAGTPSPTPLGAQPSPRRSQLPTHLPRQLPQVAVGGAAAEDPRLRDPLVRDQVLVRYKPGGVAVASSGGTRPVPLSDGGAASTVPLLPGESLAAGIARLRKAPGVLDVLPNAWVRAASPELSYSQPSDPKSSWAMQRISAGYAWGGAGVRGDSQTSVCIIGAKHVLMVLVSLKFPRLSELLLLQICCCGSAAAAVGILPSPILSSRAVFPPPPQTLAWTAHTPTSSPPASPALLITTGLRPTA